MKKKIVLGLGMSLLIACSTNETAIVSPSSTPTPVVEEELKLKGSEPTILPDEKKEVVYVDADAFGKPIETNVNVTLHGITSNNYVLDESILTNIKNTNGDEEYYTYGSQLAWDNRNADIQYKGVATKELPVGVKVTYYLNGNEINPNELVGKDGHLRIRFDYYNYTSKNVTVNNQSYSLHIPFMMMTTAMLPSDVFSNVKTTNGRQISMGDQSIFVGIGFPNLEDDLQFYNYTPTKDLKIANYSELEADVKNFKLDYTATIATTNFLEDLDTKDLDDMEDLADDLNEAKDGVKELKDCTNELADGLNKYKEGLDQYFDGIYNLCIAMDKYVEGFKELDKNSKTLVDGSTTISNGLKQINDQLQKIDINELNKALDPKTKEQLAKVLQQLMLDVQTLNNDNEQVQESLTEMKTFLEDAKSYSDHVTNKATEAKTKLSTINKEQLSQELNTEAIRQAKKLVQTALAETELTEEQKQAVLSSLDTIDLSASLDGLNQTVSDVNTTLDEINALEIPEIQTQLVSMQETANDLQQQLTILNTALSGNEKLVAFLSQMGGMVEELQKGIGTLTTGSQEYTKGVTEYTGGVHALYLASTEFQDGIGKLWVASNGLNDGFKEIIKGVNEMKNGVHEFDQQAIDEINKYAGNELKNSISRMKGIKELDGQYENYSGIPEGVKGSVYFVIETEGIK